MSSGDLSGETTNLNFNQEFEESASLSLPESNPSSILENHEGNIKNFSLTQMDLEPKEKIASNSGSSSEGMVSPTPKINNFGFFQTPYLTPGATFSPYPMSAPIGFFNYSSGLPQANNPNNINPLQKELKPQGTAFGIQPPIPFNYRCFPMLALNNSHLYLSII